MQYSKDFKSPLLVSTLQIEAFIDAVLQKLPCSNSKCHPATLQEGLALEYLSSYLRQGFAVHDWQIVWCAGCRMQILCRAILSWILHTQGRAVVRVLTILSVSMMAGKSYASFDTAASDLKLSQEDASRLSWNKDPIYQCSYWKA